MSFLSPLTNLLSPLAPIVSPFRPALSQIPIFGHAFDDSYTPFSPNVPSAQTAFVNKYNTLNPYLGRIDPSIRNSLINFDINRVQQGQNPLPVQQSLQAIQAASTHQAVTAAPQPQPRDFWSNSVRDVTELADGILHLPLGLASEAKKVVTEGPADLGAALSAGGPVQIAHALATTVPGLRDIPGAYTIGNLTGGMQGLNNELTNPVYSALDVLPFAQHFAEGTAVNEAQVAAREAAQAEGKFAPQLRPIRTVLTRTLDDEGNVVPNTLGRATAALSQTRPGQFVNDMWSQEARQASRLEGAANVEYHQQINPTKGLPSTDPLVVATRDAQLLNDKYGITPERNAYLMQQSSLGTAATNPAITDTERAFLTDASTIQKKITDYAMNNDMLRQFNGEYYDVPTASRLNAAQSRVTSLQGRLQANVLPKLQTSFDNYGDERVGNLISAIQDGRTADANRIANGLYRGKTRLDAPQAVLTPPRFSAADVGPADASLGAIGGIRQTLRDTLAAEKKLERVTSQSPPARFQPLIAERAAGAYAKTLAGRTAPSGELIAPVTSDVAGQMAANILSRNTFNIPGFDPKEFRDTIADITRTWQDMRDNEGLNPTYYHRVTPEKAAAALYRGVSDTIPSVAATKARLADISPGVNNIGVSLSRQGMDYLNRIASENYIKSMVDAFGVNKAQLAQSLAPEAERLAALNPSKDFGSHLKDLITRTHVEFDPTTYFRAGSKLGSLDYSETMIPKGVANNLAREANPAYNKLSSILSPVTNTFRTAVLPLSPRWMVYHILGGAIMSSAASGLGAFKYISEARNVLRDLASEDPELVAAAQDRITRPVALGLGGMTRDAQEMNFRAATTMRRIFEEINSPVAQRMKDIASAASGGIHKITDRSYEINQMFDDTYRVMSYLNTHDKALAKGASESVAQSTAVETARRIIHQWDEYTPIERQILRQVMPFYGFTQHIMRFAAKYPFDHPIRADLLGSISRNELADQGTGLPTSFLNSFFFGGEDSMGNQKALSLTGINPFRDVANMMTLAGFARSTTPILNTLLQQFGIKNGQAELYPNLHYDPTSGQLTAVHDNPFVNFLSNVIPQTQVLTALTGTSAAFKGLLAADPAAAKRALIGAAGLPVLYRNYDLPAEYFKAEVKRQAAESKAKNDAYKSGDYSYAEQFPGLQGLSDQVAQLQSTGQLQQFDPANAAQTNPAYAAQVRQLTGG